MRASFAFKNTGERPGGRSFHGYREGQAYCTQCTAAGVLNTGGSPTTAAVPRPLSITPAVLATFRSGRPAMSSIQNESGCPPGQAQCVTNPRSRGVGQFIDARENSRYGATANPPEMEGCGCAACLTGYWCARAQPITWIDEYPDCNCMACGAPLGGSSGASFSEALENPIKGWNVPITDLSAWHEKPAQIVIQAADGSDALYDAVYTEAFVKQGEVWDPDFPNYKWQIWAHYDGEYTWLDRTEAESLAWINASDGRKRRQVETAPGAYVPDGQFYRTWPRLELAGAARTSFVPALKSLAKRMGIDTSGEWGPWFVPTFDSLFLDVDGSRIPLSINAGPCGMCPLSQAPPSDNPDPPAAHPGIVNIIGDEFGTATGITQAQASEYTITTGGHGGPTTVEHKGYDGNTTTKTYGADGSLISESFNGVPVPTGTDDAKQLATECAADPSLEKCQPPGGPETDIPWVTIGLVGAAAAAFLLLRRR